MPKKVLWIEDAAYNDLDELSGYVNSTGEYDLSISTNATEAINCLIREQYDIVIVDIRIPAGEGKEWRDLYYELGGSPGSAKLGLHLLYSICSNDKARIKLSKKPPGLVSCKIGVLTVETGLDEHTKELGINAYVIKSAVKTDEKTLYNIINEVMRNNDTTAEE